MSREARHSSGSVEHMTPPVIVEASRVALGGIDLDPASNDVANRDVVKAKRYFTVDECGLRQRWHGRVFLNPPGGRIHPETFEPVEHGGASSAKVWWFKLASEWVAGNVESAVFLAFNLELLQTTQVKVPEDADGDELPVPLDFPICFPKHRLSFLHLDGGALEVGRGPTHANAIIFLPARGVRKGLAGSPEAFRASFIQHGRVR